jgi:hypothetical protein
MSKTAEAKETHSVGVNRAPGGRTEVEIQTGGTVGDALELARVSFDKETCSVTVDGLETKLDQPIKPGDEIVVKVRKSKGGLAR